MPRMKMSAAALFALVSAGLAFACGGGGGYTQPAAPSTPASGTIGATIHITATGVVPNDVTIEPGQRVRFVNDDTRPHQIQTNPHLFHTDCPPNNIAILNPGQSAETTAFEEAKGCGYHNHLLPDTASYYGVIRVGSLSDPGPVYSRGW